MIWLAAFLTSISLAAWNKYVVAQADKIEYKCEHPITSAKLVITSAESGKQLARKMFDKTAHYGDCTKWVAEVLEPLLKEAGNQEIEFSRDLKVLKIRTVQND